MLCRMTQLQRERILFLYTVSLYVFIFIFVALTCANLYVRWTINKDFSFLPGFGFETIGLIVLGQLLGFAYLLKSHDK